MVKIKMKAVDLTDLMAQAQNTGRELGRNQADKAAVYEKLYASQDKVTHLEAKVSSLNYQVDDAKVAKADVESDRDQLYDDLQDSRELILNLRFEIASLKDKVNPPNSHPFTANPQQECRSVIASMVYGNKIGAIKAVRALTGMGLKEAKDLVCDAEEAGKKIKADNETRCPVANAG